MKARSIKTGKDHDLDDQDVLTADGKLYALREVSAAAISEALDVALPPVEGGDLVEIMEAHNLSSNQLARELGVSVSTIKGWRSGDRQPLPYMWRALRDLIAEHKIK